MAILIFSVYVIWKSDRFQLQQTNMYSLKLKILEYAGNYFQILVRGLFVHNRKL